MLTHEKLKEKALQRKGVKDTYDALEPEYAVIRELLRARLAAGLTQTQVAERMHTKSPAVARLESLSGKHSPSLGTLAKYAEAVGCKLEIRLVPCH